MGFSFSTIDLKNANLYLTTNHRHLNKTWVYHKYSIAAFYDNRLCGVVVVGRPKARLLQDGFTVEIVRCCTDGTPNACSFLYGKAVKAAKALGYKKVITYTLESENGASLRSANFIFCGICGGGTWNRKGRQRVDNHDTNKKVRWEYNL